MMAGDSASPVPLRAEGPDEPAAPPGGRGTLPGRAGLLPLILALTAAIAALYAAMTTVVANAQPWEGSLVAALGAGAVALYLLHRRRPHEAGLHAPLALALAWGVLFTRVVAMLTLPGFGSDGGSVFLTPLAYVPALFVVGILLLDWPWSIVLNLLAWLALAAGISASVIPLIGTDIAYPGYQSMLMWLWFGCPATLTVIFLAGSYLARYRELEWRAQQADEFLQQTRLAERERLEIARKNRLLAQQKNEIEQLTAALTHDLKSPVQLMTMNAQVLLATEPDLGDTARRTLEGIVINGRQCHFLMDALVRYTRIGHQSRQIERLDMNALVDALIAGYTHQTGAAIHVERVTDLPSVSGDRVLITELLRNLIDNGLKYNRSPRREVRIAGRIDGDVELSVTDNGIGLPSSRATEAARMFVRLPGADQFGRGMGVGLAFVCRIAELHHGWVRFEPGPGQGTCVRVGLPSARGPEQRYAGRDAPPETDDGAPGTRAS